MLCDESAGFHVWAVIGNGSCLSTVLTWGFYTIKGDPALFSGFGFPNDSALV